jgi:hypothetical protein
MLTGQPIPVEMRSRPRPLSSPNIYLVRMGVFIVLSGFVAFILHTQLTAAFFGNPGLNGLILGVLLVGIILAVRQVGRLYREIRWVNRLGDGPDLVRSPVLLAPMAAMLGDGGQTGRLNVTSTRALLDSIAARLDENRELVRYLAGLLVFLGLLGTFWGLIDTVNSVGRIIGSLRTGSDSAVLFEELKTQLAAPLSGMGVSFSASLFGLSGSLVLGFLDLQAGQAQNRFYTELEDWLAVSTHAEPAAGLVELSEVPADLALAIQRLSEAVGDGALSRNASSAMANLAEGIQGLVTHMRSEQQLIRDWVEAQASRDKELKVVLDRLARERLG